MYPISKYKYYITKNKSIIAVSSYAGKTVKGTAKLNPVDSFNEEFGKELAAARCEVKVAKRRLIRSEDKLAEAAKQLFNAKWYYKHMLDYNRDANADYEAAKENEKRLKDFNLNLE